ncbi:MAG: chemotaxis-specific protein-glutamate methyltransferase CheB [Anaerolineae bacterium]|nr:chemotaxis-specific protein-glutamate methyltransferase CheB [Anaerolineae bacterium]
MKREAGYWLLVTGCPLIRWPADHPTSDSWQTRSKVNDDREVIRILVVDDSTLIREVLVAMLQTEPEFRVVGQAHDGREAVQLTASLRPDVVTMDIHMPHMNGLEAIRQIMSTTPTPIAVVAGGLREGVQDFAAEALTAGALTVVEKPHGLAQSDYESIRGQLVAAIRLIAGVELVTLSGTVPGEFGRGQKPKVIAIGASTGGPGVLHRIFQGLPRGFSLPIVVAQHITAGFGAGFVRWLNDATPIEVRMAHDGDVLAPGCALVAPEARHLTVDPAARCRNNGKSNGCVRLDSSPPVQGLRPSATRLFNSVAQAYGAAAVGILLTGMGSDGAEGLEYLWQAGGYTVAQDEASCVVFGMPKVAIERGIVRQVLTPDEITAFLIRLNERRQ